MFCSACASPNLSSARRCLACGSALPATTDRAGTSRFGGSAARVARTLRRRVIRVLAVIPVLAVLATAVAGGVRHQRDHSDQATAYARGVAAEATGRYDLALLAYTDAGGYRDAAARRDAAAAVVAPYQAAYLDGLAALEAGEYDRAIAALAPVARDLPVYADAPLLLADARDRRAEALAYEAEQAASRRDWLVAERALATLLADDPDDAALATRLEDLRREHAPVVFTHNHALYVVGPDLQDERLVTSDVLASMPVWSPDRSLIAFVGQRPRDISGDNRLYVVAPDGSGLRNLAGFVDASRAPAWSPDGRTIAFTAQEPFDGPFGPAVFSVRTVDLANGAVRNHTAADLRYASAPAWSPDASRLAFVGIERAVRPAEHPGSIGGAVFVLTVATGEVAPLAPGLLPDASLLAWSPVGDRLLVFGYRQANFRQEASSSIRLLDLRSGEVREVHIGPNLAMAPVWSPDGSRYAFTEGEHTVHVRAVRGDGGTILNIRKGLSGDLTWSPDGRALLAVAASPADASSIIELGRNLGQQTYLALAYDPLPYTGPPQWSPVFAAPPPGPATVGGTAWDGGED